MSRSGSRTLAVLALVHVHPGITGAELAERLEVTPRTIRTDVQRLRELGYPMRGRSGDGGGYQLADGTALPPLLIDDDEAIAMAIGLRTAAAGLVRGIQEPALRALGKLDTLLPSPLRSRVASMAAAIDTVVPAGPVVDPQVLVTLASAIRAREVVRFDYVRHDGGGCRRDVEPHRLLSADQRWYLIGWETSRGAWRTYRVDRMTLKVPNGPRFPPRDPPSDGFEEFLSAGLSAHAWPVVGRFRLHAPYDQLRDRVHLTEGILAPLDRDSCLLTVGADDERFLFVIVGIFDVDFSVLGPPSVRARAAVLARRYRDAASDP